MADELEKISGPRSLRDVVSERPGANSGIPELERALILKGQGLPWEGEASSSWGAFLNNSELFDRNSLLATEQGVAHRRAGMATQKAIYGNKPVSFERALADQKSLLGKSTSTNLPSTIAKITGRGSVVRDAIESAADRDMPSTVVTVGGLLAGTMLLNHIVKKYRDEQNKPIKKGKR